MPGVPRSTMNAERAGPAGVRVGPRHDQVQVRPLVVPAPDVARPVLAAVDHVVVAVRHGRDTHPGAAAGRGVEVRGAARGTGRLARRVADYEFPGIVGGGPADESSLLLFGAVVPHRHQAQAIHQNCRGKSGVDRADLLRRDHEVDVGEAATTVLGGQHREGDAALHGLGVGRFGEVEAGQRIGFGVGLPDDGRQHVASELAGRFLDLALLRGQGEIDRHWWYSPSFAMSPHPKLVLRTA